MGGGLYSCGLSSCSIYCKSVWLIYDQLTEWNREIGWFHNSLNSIWAAIFTEPSESLLMGILKISSLLDGDARSWTWNSWLASSLFLHQIKELPLILPRNCNTIQSQHRRPHLIAEHIGSRKNTPSWPSLEHPAFHCDDNGGINDICCFFPYFL